MEPHAEDLTESPTAPSAEIVSPSQPRISLWTLAWVLVSYGWARRQRWENFWATEHSAIRVHRFREHLVERCFGETVAIDSEHLR